MTDPLSQLEFAELRSGGAAAFRALIENLDQCVYLFDGEGHCIAVNAAFCRWLDKPDSELLGHTVFDFWPSPWSDQAAAENERVLRGERIEAEEDRPRGPLALRVRLLKAPVRDGEGVVRGVLCLFRELEVRAWTKPAAAAATPAPSPASPRGMVLLADREPSIRLLAQTILRQHGYQVLSAEAGRQILQLYRQNQSAIDLVILDQHLPDISGVETINGLLAMNPQVRVLLVTAGGLPEPSWVAWTPGWSFLSKPYTGDQLIEAVRQVLNQGIGNRE